MSGLHISIWKLIHISPQLSHMIVIYTTRVYAPQDSKHQHAAAALELEGPQGKGQLRELHAELGHACNMLVAGISGLYALGGCGRVCVCVCWWRASQACMP